MSDFYDKTAKRLREYYPFSDETIEAVAGFAQKQAAFTNYSDFFSSLALPEITIHRLGKKQGAVVMDIKPTGTAKKTIVMHAPMGNPLDPNQQYQLATLAGVFPDARIIGFANPSGGEYSHVEHDLSVLQKLSIATTANVRPLVAAELDYLEKQGITDAYYVGYSFGALKALVAGLYAPEQSVKGIVTIELVSHPRSPLKLLNDFKSTMPPLGGYVAATGLDTFQEARDNSVGGRNYFKGLRRSINLAIGSLLSRINTLQLVCRVLKRNPGLDVAMAWGTQSELVDDTRMNEWLSTAEHDFEGRVVPIRIEGHKHSMGNDVHLHAAIIYEALLK